MNSGNNAVVYFHVEVLPIGYSHQVFLHRVDNVRRDTRLRGTTTEGKESVATLPVAPREVGWFNLVRHRLVVVVGYGRNK